MKPHHLLTCIALIHLCVKAEDGAVSLCRHGETSYNSKLMRITCKFPEDPDCPLSGSKAVPLVKCCSGYIKVGVGGGCVPLCKPECIHGTCVSPGECKCENGYALNKLRPYECEPICNPVCVNATCKAYNKCECYPSHVKDESDDHICKPNCFGGCEHGECVAPGKCVCRDGYTLVNSICEPDCKPGCVNGKCIRPNKCECLQNFTRNQYITHECDPTCQQECINSTCIKPNKCQCKEGYYNDEDNSHHYSCKPQCLNGCTNAECVAPNDCQCKAGYERVTNSTCRPKCSPECRNGFCDAPSTCKCKEGFERNSSNPNVCEPKCSQKCINAICVAPSICRCGDGYFEVENTDLHYKCVPNCKYGCPHGRCVRPDECECDSGYALPPSNKSMCLPTCSKECVNGLCVGPDQCLCSEGYIPSESQWNICDAQCSSCENGECSSPGVCTCTTGYEQEGDSKQCVPSCDNECENGKCVSPNLCLCNTGFKMDNVVKLCKPFCSSGCKHGVCIDPEVCMCNDGYRDDTSGCSPFCKSDCIRGVCEAPDMCSCLQGTLKSGAFHCTLKCTASDQNDCYHDSHSSISPSKYALSEEESSLELSPNGSIAQVPCAHQPKTVTDYTHIDYSCFTHLRAEEDSVNIVCSEDKTHNPEGAEWSDGLNSTQVKTVDLIFLHRNSSDLCDAQICSDSNRVFVINRISKLSMCLLNIDENRDGVDGGHHLASVALYSIVAIVVTSAMALITAKCVARKKAYSLFERSNVIRDSRIPIIDVEPEGGEVGPQAFEYSDISDRLEDLE